MFQETQWIKGYELCVYMLEVQAKDLADLLSRVLVGGGGGEEGLGE